VIDYQVIGSPDVQPGLVISVSKDIDESANLPFRRVFLEGFRVSSGIQLLGFRPLYLSSYRIESGALVAEDPQIPWVFLLKPDPNSLPQVGYLLSSQAVEVFSWVSTQGMAEPFALRSGFLEVDPRVDTSIGLFGGSFSVLLPSTGR